METALDSKSIVDRIWIECHKVVKLISIPQYVNENRAQSIMQNGVEKNLSTKYLIMLTNTHRENIPWKTSLDASELLTQFHCQFN